MKKQWAFNWIGGGYNSVMAKTRDEALKMATEMGLSNDARDATLVPDPTTLRSVTPEEMERIDASYRGMFD